MRTRATMPRRPGNPKGAGIRPALRARGGEGPPRHPPSRPPRPSRARSAPQRRRGAALGRAGGRTSPRLGPGWQPRPPRKEPTADCRPYTGPPSTGLGTESAELTTGQSGRGGAVLATPSFMARVSQALVSRRGRLQPPRPRGPRAARSAVLDPGGLAPRSGRETKPAGVNSPLQQLAPRIPARTCCQGAMDVELELDRPLRNVFGGRRACIVYRAFEMPASHLPVQQSSGQAPAGQMRSSSTKHSRAKETQSNFVKTCPQSKNLITNGGFCINLQTSTK